MVSDAGCVLVDFVVKFTFSVIDYYGRESYYFNRM